MFPNLEENVAQRALEISFCFGMQKFRRLFLAAFPPVCPSLSVALSEMFTNTIKAKKKKKKEITSRDFWWRLRNQCFPRSDIMRHIFIAVDARSFGAIKSINYERSAGLRQKTKERKNLSLCDIVTLPRCFRVMWARHTRCNWIRADCRPGKFNLLSKDFWIWSGLVLFTWSLTYKIVNGEPKADQTRFLFILSIT